jgi:hypothetical protein
MVIPFGAPEVAHLVHHGLEPVVHGLRLFSFVKDESTKFSSIVSRLVILVTSSPSCAVLSRGDNGSSIPVGYRIRIVQIPVFSDTDLGIFIFRTDTGNTPILKLQIRVGYGVRTAR